MKLLIFLKRILQTIKRLINKKSSSKAVEKFIEPVDIYLGHRGLRALKNSRCCYSKTKGFTIKS